MILYEFTFIAQQGLTQYEFEALVKGFASLLAENGAEYIRHEYWGLLDLAYTIDKMNKGHYCMMYIRSSPGSMHEFQRKVNLNEDVLRFLCIRRDELPEGDSLMMQTNNQA